MWFPRIHEARYRVTNLAALRVGARILASLTSLVAIWAMARPGKRKVDSSILSLTTSEERTRPHRDRGPGLFDDNLAALWAEQTVAWQRNS